MNQIILADGRPVKLGRIRPKARPPVLKFSNYYDPLKDATPPPSKVDWATKAMDSLKRVYLNDQYGDCVIAGKYHQVGVWTGNDSGTAVQGTDKEVYQSYQSICGPGDNGCVITDVLDVMQSKGLPFNGVYHKIAGYVSIDWTNKLEVQVAIQLFGSLTLGINLPNAWTCTDCVWDVTNSGIVGGHDTPVVGHNEEGVQISTWGGIVTMTWPAFLSKRWIEECYVSLSPDWFGQDNLAPNGFDATKLKADLDKLDHGIIPDIDPPAPPIPPTPPPVPGTFIAPYFLWVGLVPVGEPFGYPMLGDAIAFGQQHANINNVSVDVRDLLDHPVQTLIPNAPPIPVPPNPTPNQEIKKHINDLLDQVEKLHPVVYQPGIEAARGPINTYLDSLHQVGEMPQSLPPDVVATINKIFDDLIAKSKDHPFVVIALTITKTYVDQWLASQR